MVEKCEGKGFLARCSMNDVVSSQKSIYLPFYIFFLLLLHEDDDDVNEEIGVHS